MIARTLISTVLLLTMAGANAGMYKWKDQQGNTQFGEFPPAGVEAEQMKPPPPPATPPSTKGPSLEDRVKALDARESSEKEKALIEKEEQERAAQNKQNCDNARETTKLLERGGNRVYQMPDGSYKRFNAEESQKRIEDSKKYIAEHCS